jgi:hypothetical protein
MCKRIIVIMLMLVVFGVMQADAQQLNYQAIARNANGVALTFRDVGIRLSIRDGSPNGSIVYSESRNIRTNQFGLFTVIIGSPGASNVLGSMASINWISGNKYLQVEIDPEGGTNYFQAGTSQLQAVPYALFANAAYPVGPAGGDLLGSTYPNPIIAPLAVTTGKIANQAITTPKIADLNVTTPKLADQAVTNAKIQDNTIANIKLVNSRVTLNGLILNLGDAQDFAIGTNGIDVNIVSAGNTHTFNFPDASIANRGLITPNTQTIGGNKTFNNDITAARIIRAGGLAAQFLKADGSVDNNIYLTENQPIIVTATGDATGVSTSSRTAPVLPLTLATVNSAVGTYGTNIVVPSITVNNKGLVTNVIANPIPTATAITSGLLTVGDWNIFNNKQNAIPLGSAAQYFRGDLTLSNFQTDVRNQLSAGTNITYVNGNIGLTNNSVTLNTLPLTLGGSQTFATGTTGVDFNISSAGSVHTFNIPTASVFARGLINSTDYTNFNAAYNNRIASLTTTGTSGAATLSGNVLNIPNYSITGLGGENAIIPGTTLQYWRGDKTWQTLNSSVVPEGTNFYYTDTRSRNALSITTSGSNGAATYNSALGVFNIPAYTLNGLGGVPSSRLINGLDLSADRTFSTSDIAEGSRQYFTSTRARTSISLTTVGTGGLSTYDNTTGVLNIPNYTVTGLGAEPSITAGNALQYWRGDKTWQTLNTTIVPEGTNEYYTQAKARSSISITTTGTSGSAVYSPATGVLNIPSYTLSGLGGETAITPGNILEYWRGDKTWQTLNTTIVPEGTNQYFTQAKARTSISLTTAGTNGAAAYDNTTGALNIPAYTLAGLGGVPTTRQINGVDLSIDRTFTTTEINEGTNLYFNNSRARSAIGLTTTGNSGLATYNSGTGILNIPEYTIGGLGGVSTARSINGIDLSANQSFAVGTAGTTFNIGVSGGTTHLFNIPNSSTALVTGGLLSNTDYTRFDNKQNAISGTGYSNWAGSTLSFIPQIPLGTDVTGTLLAGNFGALTGDVTNTAGSYATTISNDAITTAKILNGSVTNLKLANSSLSVGTTSISLGGSSTTLGGLTSVTSTSFIGDLTGNVTGSSGSVINSVTFNNSGLGDASGTSFNGALARTISYNSIGASPLAGSTSLTTVGTIGTGTWNGAVIGNSFGGAGTTNGLLKANGVGLVSAATAGTDYLAPFTTQTQNFVFAAPSGSNGLPSFRTLAATDIPTLNQNTTGSSGSVVNELTFASDGSGAIPTTTFNGSAARTISYNSVGASPLVGSTSLTTLGTIGTGTWNGSVIPGQYGGTGIANTGRTITLGGNITTADAFSTAGAFATTLTSTGATNVTLPTTGTLATLAGTETFTNKTLTTPIINLPAISFTNIALAAGTDAQNSAAITNDLNIITTAASSPSGITLPTASAGRRVVILNRGANAVKVYPATGGEINSLGANAAFSNIPANTYAEFYATSTTQWYSANSATASTTQWNVLGNTGLSATTNFLGTTDAVALRFRVDDTFSGQIHPDANVGNTSFGFETNSTTNNNSFTTAFGSQALRANNNSGLRNSAFGALALFSNNSGVDNTGIGQAALYSNLSANNNTAVGQGALTFNSTGSSNTAVGQAALNSNTNNSNNTAVGKSALFASTGSNNTGLGHNALIANTTGNANTSVGQNSLSSNTSTHNNTAVGWSALSLTTSSGNVGVGYNAGVNALISNSIAIGLNANVGSDNGIAIGSPATIGAASGNSIAIGLSASSTGQNGISLGELSSTSSVNSVAIGKSAAAGGENSISVGLSSNSTATGAVAIGKSASATGIKSVAIGEDASNAVDNSIKIGGTNNTLVNVTGALTATGRISGTGAKFSFNETTAATNYNISINDYYIKVMHSVTVTLPSAVGIAGQRFVIANRTSPSIDIATNIATTSSQTISGYNWNPGTNPLSVNKNLIVFSDGANWIIESDFQ